MTELPEFFALWRNRETCDAAIVHAHKMEHICKFSLVENPLQLINKGFLVERITDTWLDGRVHDILVERDSRRHGRTIYSTEIRFDNHAIHIMDSDFVIPVFELSDACKILPSQFYALETDAGEPYRFKMSLGLLLNPVLETSTEEVRRAAFQMAEDAANTLLSRVMHSAASIPSPSQLPQHIVNGYIEGLLARGETCPIEMTPLTKENACLTPCGHTMTIDVAERWLKDAGSCPLCRTPCLASQLQIWMR
jgi:hypothetical protein